MRIHSSVPAALLGAALAACVEAPFQPDAERRVGVLVLYGTQPERPLAAPDTVQAGVDFTVTVTTLGGGCERKGETETEVSGAVATVTPYDYTDVSAQVCPDVLRTFPHTTTLRFAAPGEALLRVRGRRTGPDTPRAGVPVTLERRIVVR
ncbi:MAG TPA: hypothetical protein VHG35_12970 [Gemmatimonadales bacterium]|nr:hypothetical protein [Gemmatimonadales bacterium]